MSYFKEYRNDTTYDFFECYFMDTLDDRIHHELYHNDFEDYDVEFEKRKEEYLMEFARCPSHHYQVWLKNLGSKPGDDIHLF